MEWAKDIYVFDGPAVPFFGLPYTTRMTIVRLANGKLWVHSPIELTDMLIRKVMPLGEVAYLIAPNKLHHLFIGRWQARWPDAQAFAAPGVAAKCAHLHFDADLSDTAPPQWRAEIENCIVKGSKVMQEAVFFHKASRTLILTDLIENFAPEHFSAWQRPLARITGILAPNGKTPLDWRLSFMGGKAQARMAINQFRRWQPEHIILAHGHCIRSNALPFIERSFSWVGEPRPAAKPERARG
ncbi:DUF4336 domain-containing protein [Shewanella sp. JM162201]|uniref:DUF4336 domain-containing protein n=1 Tax=Shewanella jiangmenensis TaxID=2837387 RepID=A0ABS5V6Y5_9GAMM|nr:DUF4336 domain-containing protein [Shewanella jiangmenensis]MBT1445700.1 DUF4336 domain-containing protein [Shewanella jiangmenensis]